MAKTSESDLWGQDSLPDGERAGAGSAFVKETLHSRRAPKARVVRDDWDDDDDEEEETDRDKNEKYGNAGANLTSRTKIDSVSSSPQSAREDSSRIWEEANKQLPMPELIVASASTSQSMPPPPPAALQPTLRILKRQPPNTSAGNIGLTVSASLASSPPGSTPGSSSGSGGTSPAPRGTFAEREAQYQEARSRIFGEKEKLGNASGQANPLMLRTSAHLGGGVVVIRDPLGPRSEPELEPVGHDTERGPGRPERGFVERRRGKK